MSFARPNPSANTPPSSPSKSHDEINKWLGNICQTYRLPFVPRDRGWSPNKVDSSGNDEEQCWKRVQFLYFQKRAALDNVELQCRNTPPNSIQQLALILKEEVRLQAPSTPSFQRSASSILQEQAVLSSFQGKLDQSKAAQPIERPRTPTEDSGDEFNTPPESPSRSVNSRPRSHKRSSDASHQDDGEQTKARKSLRTSRSSRSSRKSDTAQISFGSTMPSTSIPLLSFQSTNSGLRLSNRSFETDITDPDPEPAENHSSSFSMTTSDGKAFQTLGYSKSRNSETNSSQRYTVDSETGRGLIAAVESFELTNQGLQQAGDSFEQVLQSSSPRRPDRIREQPGPPENYKIRNFPSDGLFLDGPESANQLPFFAQFECARVAAQADKDIDDIIKSVPLPVEYDAFWQAVRKAAGPSHFPCPRSSKKAWDVASASASNPPAQQEMGLSLSARVHPNVAGATLFSLTPDPLTIEKHSRLQRKFGGDRFLYVYFPDLKRIPELKGEPAIKEQFRRRYLEWLLIEQLWLGRKWRAIHLERVKNGKLKGGKKKDEYSFRVILFATEGLGLQSITLGECINWFVSLHNPQNLALPYCKLYSRLDLGFSRTSVACQFAFNEVQFVGDMKSNHDPEPFDYNDPKFSWSQKGFKEEVMNDGCSLISLGACQEIWKNHSGMMPSVFQARINGAKGVWIRSASPATARGEDQSHWIQITDSQKKFFHHEEDATADFFDPVRWTFDVVQSSNKPTTSNLHRDFIPILIDRGVPYDNIQALIINVLDEERDGIIQAFQDPCVLRCWLQQHLPSNNSDSRDGSLPSGPVAKANMLLEAGFDPKKLRFLAQELYQPIWWHFNKIMKSLSIPLARSTMVMGIADPYRVLKPGEIYLSFSHGFEDADNERILSLMGRDVLVARHPALRPSDIQKVRAVPRMDLDFPHNTVVFSSNGSVPLASKLQGGDYDGDTFWICWEPSLVENFLNSPAPVSLPEPESFGIVVDRRKVSDIMIDLRDPGSAGVDPLLRDAFDFRLNEDILGLVTNYHERLAYRTSLRDPGVELLADLHDHLIDSAKSGFKYSKSAFEKWKTSKRIVANHSLPDPEYKKYYEAWERSEAKKLKWKFEEQWESNAKSNPSPQKHYPRMANPTHVLDRLFFLVVDPHIEETIRLINDECAAHNTPDEHLAGIYHKQLRSDHAEIKEEMKHLKQNLFLIFDAWKLATKERKAAENKSGSFAERSGKTFTRQAEQFCARFHDLQPVNRTHETIAGWKTDGIGHSYSTWTLLKASALSEVFHKDHLFVWHLAGDVLCDIKARYILGSRLMVESMRNIMKPRIKLVSTDQVAPATMFEDNNNDDSNESDDGCTDFYTVPEH
ncbi:hypothetical protein BT63DRAFT_62686 [Microthyrium microscopicum]|uniref:RNA-dependent RNA polymerase n=1 Tax=Microthyrium microscopicum TaxID=703497 RepID=A0A6A6U2J9_9PEZI|nr:hypothetical protein BT63DRAFT_62686 [Microthyrium microscopicum]